MSLELNKKIKINIYRNSIFQAISVAAGFYLYPLLIGYLEPVALGVWLTIISITSWFMILDIGLSHGLRNKLSELIVKKKTLLAKSYLSSTYYYLGLFLFLLLILMGLILAFVDINIIFNIKKDSIEHLNVAVFLVLFSAMFNLFFSINFSLSNAMQDASFINFRNMLFNVQMIVILFILTYLRNGTLLDMAIIFMVSSLMVNFITTWVLYAKHKAYIPSVSLISFDLFSKNIKLGLDFFVINISALIMFSTDSILIAHLINVESVAQYSIILKVFMIFIMLQGFYTGPLWSAYSEMYHRSDFFWIKRTLKKSLIATFCIYIAVFFVAIFFEHILEVWLGSDDYYNQYLVVAVSMYIGIRLWSSNFSTLLNGLSVIKLQKYTSIVAAVINIPLSIYLVKYTDLGIAGIAYGSAASLGIFAVIAPFYTMRALNRKAS